MFGLLVALFFFTGPIIAQGQTAGQIVLHPSKVELTVLPDSQATTILNLANHTGKDLTVQTEIEDFTGDPHPEKIVRLLGPERGAYSLKDYLNVDARLRDFTLAAGESRTIPVKVSLPSSVKPGGLYGSIIFSFKQKEEAVGGIAVLSRLASLFFVRIPGEINAGGRLEQIRSEKIIFWSKPASVKTVLTFKNNGDIYLNPYGFIVIRNLWGREVGFQKIEPYFVMPGFSRIQPVSIETTKLFFGPYRLTVFLNRGYSDIIDDQTVLIWILPWPYWLIVGLIITGLTLLILILIRGSGKIRLWSV